MTRLHTNHNPYIKDATQRCGEFQLRNIFLENNKVFYFLVNRFRNCIMCVRLTITTELSALEKKETRLKNKHLLHKINIYFCWDVFLSMTYKFYLPSNQWFISGRSITTRPGYEEVLSPFVDVCDFSEK